MVRNKQSKWRKKNENTREWRVGLFRLGMVAFALVIIGRLIVLQVIDREFYQALASGQHEIFQELFPSRGIVYIHDIKDGSEVPIATNQRQAFIFADPRHVTEPEETAKKLQDFFAFSEEETEKLQERLSNKEDPYEPIQRHVDDDLLNRLLAEELPGINFIREETRLYPEPKLGGHVSGFIGSAEDGTYSGRYGIEGYFNKELAGTAGYLRSERDIAGRLITVGEHSIEPAVDGADILLTLDRTIQYHTCNALAEAVERHSADGGSVIVLDPMTGRIYAMCGAPDFDPNLYNEVADIRNFNNPAIFEAYEPGSVFKPFTMAAALDTNAVTPQTTYVDTGEVVIDVYTIKNSDEKAHGTQTMTEVLEKSLNTGVIFAMRETGQDTFVRYVKNFGFGELTGINLDTEQAGNISSLDKSHEVYAATAAYGQGITVTPLQLAAAYGAIANGGVLKRPFIVSEIRYADGTVDKRQTQDVMQVIQAKTARLLGAMLIAVVEHGHAGEAGVSGYYLAGKTGTAQVAKEHEAGYKEDETIATFAGFGPIENPKFVIVTRIDHPRDVEWASATAAPLFGEIAEFLLQYFEIAPSRLE